jgi:hypothetical protein
VLSAARFFQTSCANTHAASSDFGDLIIWRRLPREFIFFVRAEAHEEGQQSGALIKRGKVSYAPEMSKPINILKPQMPLWFYENIMLV